MLLSNFLRIDATLISLQRTQRGKKGSITTSHNHNLAAASPLKANLLMMGRGCSMLMGRQKTRETVCGYLLSLSLSVHLFPSGLFVSHSFKIFFFLLFILG